MYTIIHKLDFNLNGNFFWIKRDDLIPQYFGGNKVRIAKEYYKDMINKECDCLIAYGSKNSNMCRVIALLCAEKHIPCFIVYGCENNNKSNIGMNDILVGQTDAHIIHCSKNAVKDTVEKVTKSAKKMGYKPYYIFGNSEGRGNEKIGIEGYITCYNEIKKYEIEEGFEFDYIFLPSGTGITQSGLIAGEVIKNDRERIVGVSIAREKEKQEKYISYCLKQYFGETYKFDNQRIEVFDGVLQGGYGNIKMENQKFILKFIVNQSLPLDTTYVGKGMFGMIKYIETNKINNKKILFLHTGATSLFFENLLGNKKTI